MWTANRLSELPPYLFVEIDRRKREAIAAWDRLQAAYHEAKAD